MKLNSSVNEATFGVHMNKTLKGFSKGYELVSKD